MKRKGFTLIELLAVIVILAIIALIAVPIVMNIITKAGKSAFKDTAYGIIKSGELYYAEHLLDPNGMENNVTFEFPNNIGNLQIKGNVPSSGTMVVSKEGKVALAISNGKYCIKKEYNDNDINIDENIDECTLLNLSDMNVNGIMTSEDVCIKNGICKNGTLINVKVNANENYDFYVIKDTGAELTLIMNRNLNSTSWISETEYISAGGLGDANYGYGKNDKGPLESLKLLEEKTAGWSNIPSFTYTLQNDSDGLGGSYTYSSITRSNVRTKMLTRTDMINLGCTENNNSCPKYLYTNTYNNGNDNGEGFYRLGQNLGYWLSTTNSIDKSRAWYVSNEGKISYADTDYLPHWGIRAVITIVKNQ